MSTAALALDSTPKFKLGNSGSKAIFRPKTPEGENLVHFIGVARWLLEMKNTKILIGISVCYQLKIMHTVTLFFKPF